jgi:hypothetical protein
MMLIWQSNATVLPQFQLGLVSKIYDTIINATSDTYTKSDLCGGLAVGAGWMSPGQIHYALAQGLRPSTTYFYRYGDEESGGWSKEYKFKTAPSTSPNNNIRVVTFGDMGNAERDKTNMHYEVGVTQGITDMIVERENSKAHMVLNIGDLSYAKGNMGLWDAYLEQQSFISHYLPTMTGVGNHERSWTGSGGLFDGVDSRGECGVPYEKFYPMPTPGRDKLWYAFDYGNIHFTVMSSEHNFSKGSEQYQFLEHDLRSVDRTKTPWLIFAGHRAFYVNSGDTSPHGDLVIGDELVHELEDLLIETQVDLSIEAHNHSYQKTCRAKKGKCVGTGVTHVVVGMAGMSFSTNLAKVAPEVIEFMALEHGYCYFETSPISLRFAFVNTEGRESHSFTLTK